MQLSNMQLSDTVCILHICKNQVLQFSFSPYTVIPGLSLLGMNFPATPFQLKSWQCSTRTLSYLIVSCPGPTNHCLAHCFYNHCYYLFYLYLLSSPTTLVSFSLLMHTAYKHLVRWKALNVQPENMIVIKVVNVEFFHK